MVVAFAVVAVVVAFAVVAVIVTVVVVADNGTTEAIQRWWDHRDKINVPEEHAKTS